MPIHEYECENCGYQFEVLQKIKDRPLKRCERCGGRLRRLISQTSFVLKGSGWYATDYASESRKKTVSEEKGEGHSKGASVEKPKKKGEAPKVATEAKS